MPTVFQKTGRLLDFLANADIEDFENLNNFSDKSEDEQRTLLRASSENSYATANKELEQQQFYFMQKQYKQIKEDSEYKALQAQSLRLPAYMDYMLMDYDPIIGAALNIVAEEASTVNDKGNVLNIYSDNKEVRTELENLFFNIIDINTMAFPFIRNMCRYGDNFVYLLSKPDVGITTVRQLPALEIERKENAANENELSTKFIWRDKNEELTPYQVAHFRLISDDRLLPYGTSMLEKVRITWKMLKMVKDAMLVNRVVRAAERKVIKVPVGNIDPDDIKAHIQAAAMSFKKSKLIDPNTGQINYKFNPATIQEDIFIPDRTENGSLQNPIETLGGATNLDQVEDVKILKDDLYTGLEVPRPLLSFDENVEGGNNLAMIDIRFARKINRIQQSFIQELNKIAIIHLSVKGFDKKHILNFKLRLNNPSIQGEILKTEHLNNKIDLYVRATTKNEKGIAPMSETKAKREILGFDDDMILDDIQQQMVESIVGEEINIASVKFKSSGIFDKLKKYLEVGIVNTDKYTDSDETEEQDDTQPQEEPTQDDQTDEIESLNEEVSKKDVELPKDVAELFEQIQSNNNKPLFKDKED